MTSFQPAGGLIGIGTCSCLAIAAMSTSPFATPAGLGSVRAEPVAVADERNAIVVAPRSGCPATRTMVVINGVKTRPRGTWLLREERKSPDGLAGSWGNTNTTNHPSLESQRGASYPGHSPWSP